MRLSGRAWTTSAGWRAALAWGLLWAVIGAAALYRIAPNPWPIQGSRASGLMASLTVLDHGGPAIVNGVVYVNSGGGDAHPGNVLLAFSVDGK